MRLFQSRSRQLHVPTIADAEALRKMYLRDLQQSRRKMNASGVGDALGFHKNVTLDDIANEIQSWESMGGPATAPATGSPVRQTPRKSLAARGTAQSAKRPRIDGGPQPSPSPSPTHGRSGAGNSSAEPMQDQEGVSMTQEDAFLLSLSQGLQASLED